MTACFGSANLACVFGQAALTTHTDFSNTPRELAECFQTIKNAELACLRAQVHLLDCLANIKGNRNPLAFLRNAARIQSILSDRTCVTLLICWTCSASMQFDVFGIFRTRCLHSFHRNAHLADVHCVYYTVFNVQ